MEIKRCYDTIVGASVGRNQLVQSGATSVTVQSGHKYYAKINGTESLGASTGSAITINDSAKDMVIDLSLYLPANIVDYIYSLESATAGSGIAKLRSWGFLRGYQAFNSGSLESVEVTGKKVVGFNQFDKTTEIFTAYLGNSGGGNAWIYSSDSRSVIVKCLPNTQYYLHTSGLEPSIFRVGDISGELPTGTGWTIPVNKQYGTITGGAGTYTTSEKAEWLIVQLNASIFTDAKENLCVNIYNEDRNGEYEAYAEQSYDYGTDTLNGIFKLDANNQLYADGDRKESDGTITRKYSLVDLGTLNYTAGARNTANTGNTFYTSGLSGLAKGGGNLMSAKLVVNPAYNAAWEALALNEVKFGSPTSTTVIVCLDVTGADACKSALNGFYLLYELATPTTEQGDPFPSPQVCYPDGTEEYETSNGVPVGHETRYEL